MTSNLPENGAMPSEKHERTPQQDGRQPQTPRKKARRLWLKTLLAFAVLLLAVLCGLVYWLAATESGLRFGLYRLPALAGVNIASKTLEGTLWHGFSGEGWRVGTEGADVDISRFTFQWQPAELSDGLLHIERLAAGDIHIVTKPTPPKPKEPRKLPASLKLPLNIVADEISVGKITIGKNQTAVLQNAEAAYRYDKQKHFVEIKTVKTEWSYNEGTVSLDDSVPFALNGKITGGGQLSEHSVSGEILLGGNLEKVSLNADLVGGNITLTADTELSPFANGLDEIVGHIRAKGQGLNPQDFFASVPKALLDFNINVLPQFTDGLALRGEADLNNKAAAAADRNGIPVRRISSRFTVDENGVLTLGDSEAALLKQGVVKFSGSTDTAEGRLKIDTDIKNFTLADVITQTFDETVNGRIEWRGTYGEPQAQWTLKGKRAESSGKAGIALDTAKGQRTLNLADVLLAPYGGGRLKAAGKMEWFGKQALALDVDSQNFNPAKLFAQFPSGNVNGNIKFNGLLAEKAFGGKLAFAPSTLSGVDLRGSADVWYEKEHLSRAVSDVLLGRNRVKTDGSFGKAGDRLNVDIAAPDLDKFGFGLSGQLNAKGYISGEPKKIEANLKGSVRDLRAGGMLHISSLDFSAQGSPDYTKPLNVSLHGNRVNIADTQIERVDLDVKGTGVRHTIRGSGNLSLDGKPYKLNVAADGGLNPDNLQWKGTVGALDVAGAFNLKLQNAMSLEAGAERVALGAARWSAMGGSLNLANFVWDKKNGIVSKGSADNLRVSELHNFFTPPVEHNLVLAGDWDLAYSQNARGYLNIRQQSGDVVLPHRKQSLGLEKLTLQTRFQNGRIDNVLSGQTRYGALNGNVAVSQQFGNRLADAPINGKVQLNAPDLNALKHLMPVGHTVRGSLQAEAVIGGTVGTPQLNGTLNGDNLYYVNREVGLILDKGSLRSRLSGQKWLIDSLQFTRGGTVKLDGSVSLDKGEPDVNVRVLFDKYQALDKPNRRLTVSGETKLTYLPAVGVGLIGGLKVDEGRFGFQKSGMPELGDDVVVLGEEAKPQSEPLKISMDLLLDLNDRFRFSGEGLDVTLGGKLNLTAKPGQDVRGVGTVKVVKGKYKAYAQDLNITKGTISFVGPLTQPNLNIRAVRNQSPVGAGVEVLGNLSQPRITLVADEAMSEKDKLSWLILNRASSGSDGDEAALSAAGAALLAGSINDKIGLVDDFGFASQRSRNAQTGELNPAEQVLTVGKQLTNDLYLGYEYGITSANQSVKLIYQLSKSIQAIARVGSVSWGGEVKYVVRFD
ncbi:MAG: translocation/assembly module TamB domain-containing protein [Neisseria sp.]|nr:translocation/assembly module TamB domain-containing protein [Neisseria sp.]